MYAPESTNASALRRSVGPLLAMDDDSLMRLVPPQAGFFFVSCPNCSAGSVDNQLTWSPEMGDKVKCRYCNHVFPDDRYPENAHMTVKTPTGGAQVFRFHESSKGTRHWFESRRWFAQREVAERGAYDLAQLWWLEGDAEAGRKAATILKRFADLYPDYVIHYDYPGDPKRFFADGPPTDSEIQSFTDVESYRAAKWSCWAYMDVSKPLAKAYDLLAAGDLLTEKDRRHIENDLLRAMVGYVHRIKNSSLTNMHPTLWTDSVVVSRVLDDPELASDIMPDLQRMLKEQFFFDGFWRESTVSYHKQTIGNLRLVLQALRPDLTSDALDRWIEKEYPEMSASLKVYEKLRLPDNRYIPVGDTWHADKSHSDPPASSVPVLMPAFGYAVLGMGSGSDQLQAHLNFTGMYGHHHCDSLGLLIYACGKELLSDIGYTHTRQRSWATSTLSHNTVVIDRKNQFQNSSEQSAGYPLMFCAKDPRFQVVQAEMPGAYRGLATMYRRLLAAVESSGGVRYVVDVFDVAGGQSHDWILHGSADEAQTLELTDRRLSPLPTSPVESLLPSGVKPIEPINEKDDRLLRDGNLAYGMFREVRSARTDGCVVATFRDIGGRSTGIRSWIVGGPGTEVFAAVSPAVRGAGSDDAKLREYWRQSLIVSRKSERGRFVAVHSPFDTEPAVKGVSTLLAAGEYLVLKIEHTGGIDYFFLNGAGASSAQDGSITMEFDGRVALVQTGGGKPEMKMVGGRRLAFGSHVLSGKPDEPAKLVGVKGNQLTVQGKYALEAGDVIIVGHGDGRTTALHVARTETLKDTTRITTAELGVFTSEANGDLTMKHFPNTRLPGPHVVKVTRRHAVLLPQHSGGGRLPR